MVEKQLSIELMKQAVKGVAYMVHPTRLRIIEYLDVNGSSSVSSISNGIDEERIVVSQHLKKLKEADLLKTHRKGVFIYYELEGEYPASLFKCVRKLFGYMTNSLKFLSDDYRAILPKDFTMMVANQIKLFANFDKMRILEFLEIKGESCVSDISTAINIDQMKLSQYLKMLRDDGFVKTRRDGRYIYYTITKGVHKTVVSCMRNKFLNNQ